MIWEWIKKNWLTLVAASIMIGLLVYGYGCEPQTLSLLDNNRRVNRQELQYEFAQLSELAQLRMVDLDKQEQLRAVILQNALILVQGQPLNPVGLITAFAAIYGVGSAGTTATKIVKNIKVKRKVNNGVT